MDEGPKGDTESHHDPDSTERDAQVEKGTRIVSHQPEKDRVELGNREDRQLHAQREVQPGGGHAKQRRVVGNRVAEVAQHEDHGEDGAERREGIYQGRCRLVELERGSQGKQRERGAGNDPPIERERDQHRPPVAPESDGT